MSKSKLAGLNTKMRIQIAATSALLAGFCAFSSRTANAAPFDGAWAGAVSACNWNYHIGPSSSNPSSRIQAWNPYTNSIEDYGWFEWRYSSNGACNGYQWTRLHIEHNLVVSGGGWLSMAACRNDGGCIYPNIEPQHINVPVSAAMWTVTASVLEPGVYDGGLLYSPDVQACSSFLSTAIVGNSDFYTSAWINGNICA
jgi:hypothetical protein